MNKQKDQKKKQLYLKSNLDSNEKFDKALDNKLIGIISHVTELKERLNKKIVVSKTQNGNNLVVEY